jgi:hypothetical protein
VTSLPLLFVFTIAAIVLVLAVRRFLNAWERQRHDASIQQMLALFGPATAESQQDPRLLLAWYPIARTSRALFPDAFAALDKASGGTFPFSKDRLQAAHARCSSEWLAWERAHDAEFSLKSAQVEDDIVRAGGPASPLLRTRLAAIEQQKLERYQQRYEEYVKTAKALAAFTD